MDHSRKINRAIEMSAVGKYPRTAKAALSLIPDALIERFPSVHLALLLNVLDKSHNNGRALEAESILREGAIYDPRTGKMREINP